MKQCKTKTINITYPVPITFFLTGTNKYKNKMQSKKPKKVKSHLKPFFEKAIIKILKQRYIQSNSVPKKHYGVIDLAMKLTEATQEQLHQIPLWLLWELEIICKNLNLHTELQIVQKEIQTNLQAQQEWEEAKKERLQAELKLKEAKKKRLQAEKERLQAEQLNQQVINLQQRVRKFIVSLENNHGKVATKTSVECEGETDKKKLFERESQKLLKARCLSISKVSTNHQRNMFLQKLYDFSNKKKP